MLSDFHHLMRHVTKSHLTMDESSRQQFATFMVGIFTYLSSTSSSLLCCTPRKYNRVELIITGQLSIIFKQSFGMDNSQFACKFECLYESHNCICTKNGCLHECVYA